MASESKSTSEDREQYLHALPMRSQSLPQKGLNICQHYQACFIFPRRIYQVNIHILTFTH